MANTNLARSAILPTLPLLITESESEFDRIREALEQDIRPRGIIEQIYVADISHLVWEILRLRRCKAGIINSAFHDALKKTLRLILGIPGNILRESELARGWFLDPDAKKQIVELLHEFQLDETAVEAEAIRRSAADLERIDRLLASAEARRDKALVCIAQYRGDFGELLREGSNRMVDDKVRRLKHAPGEKQKSAA
jgi:hypothetical protein